MELSYRFPQRMFPPPCSPCGRDQMLPPRQTPLAPSTLPQRQPSAASPRLPRQGPAQAAPFPFWRAECPQLAELTPCWQRPCSLHGTFIFRSLTAIKTYLDYFQSDSPLNLCSSGGQVLCPHPKRRKAKQNETKRTGPGPKPFKRASSRTSAVPRAGSEAPREGPQPQHGHRGSRSDSRCSAPCSQHPHHGPHLSCHRLPTAALPRTHSRRHGSCPSWWPGCWMAGGRCHHLSPHTAPAAGGCCRPWLPPAHGSSSNGSVFNSNGFVF